MAITKKHNRNGTTSHQVRVHKPGADKVYVGTFRSESRAIAAEKAAKERFAGQRHDEPTLGEFAADYAARAPVADQTRKLYASALRRFGPDLNAMPLSTITRQDIEVALDRLSSRLKPSTVQHSAQILKSCLYAAVDWGMMDEVPNMRKLRIKGERHHARVRVLTDTQASKLIDNAGALRRFLLVASATGMRRGEIIGLEWRDLRDGCIHVERQVSKEAGLHGLKTRAAYRIIPLPDNIRDMLEAERGDGPMFTGVHGGRIDIKRVVQQFDIARTAAGLTCTMHDLRHTYASNLIRAGVDIKTVQYLMGHESISTTLDTYGHLMPGYGDVAARAIGATMTSVLGRSKSAVNQPQIGVTEHGDGTEMAAHQAS